MCTKSVTNADIDTKNKTQEILDEVKFFMKLDHPNCHYLLGAKTTLDNGGILELTEVCENGSLFDLYCQKGTRFSAPTAWRIGRECALGYDAIHDIGYMHRDIKSLWVFLYLILCVCVYACVFCFVFVYLIKYGLCTIVCVLY